MESTPRKLVLIGAGSVSFSRGLLADLIRATDCTIQTVALVDISAPALETMVSLAQRMVRGRRDDLSIEGSVDRREVLTGADYVVTTFAVGGWRARQEDLRIPRQYGLYLPVGDTVGPGGCSRVLRHVPVVAEIAGDIAELCPQAWWFNYANPLSTLVRAATMVRPERTIGLCHGLPERARRLCEWVGVPADDWDLDAAGLNHCTWITHLHAGGSDVLARLRAKLDAGETGSWLDDNPFTRELFELYGALPVPGDRHVIEFYPQFFRDGYYGGGRPGVDVWDVEQTLVAQRERFQRMCEEADGARPLDTSAFERRAGDHEQLLDIIRAIEQDTGQVFTANVPNGRILSQLPAEATVEVPVVFRDGNWQACAPRPLPDGVVAHQTQRAIQQELNVQAALRGDRSLALQALLDDGWVPSVAAARRMLDEFLEIHREHLPRFWT